MAYRELREFIAHLESSGQLVHISEEVETRYGIAAYIRKTSDTGGPALLFDNVVGHDIPVAGGLFANRHLMLEALASTEDNAVDDFLTAVDAAVPPRLVDSGPCKEVVRLGEDIDLSRLPVPTYCDLDSGPFLTSAVAISHDLEDGSKNASIYRFEVQGRDRLGVLSPPPHHLGIHIAKAESLNQPLDVALAVGVPPAVLIATQWEAPYGVDELELAGGLLGGPLEVVKAETSDLQVPAHAELIIEGTVHPGVLEQEGPFGEYTGYYTPAYPKPVMQVNAITHRRDMIFQAMLTGEPTTENHVLKMIPAEASCFAMLKSRFPGVKKVHFHGAGGVGLLGIVAMEQHAKNEARNALTTMLGAQGTKMVIVVDPDVDIFDLDSVMWAVSTRCQPDRDVIILPEMMGWQLDPSAPEIGRYAVMGIDATMPFGETFDVVAKVPGTDQVPDF